MPGRMAVVDSENRFLRWEQRRVLHEQRLPHRSVQVFIFDSSGKLVLQRRHRNKQTYPSTWDVSCSGHVEESDYLGGPDERLAEVYAGVAARELEEELGVKAPLELLGHFGPEPGVHYEHFHFYRGRSDGPFTPQASEVEQLCRVDLAELDAFSARQPVTHTLLFLAQWLRENRPKG